MSLEACRRYVECQVVDPSPLLAGSEDESAAANGQVRPLGLSSNGNLEHVSEEGRGARKIRYLDVDLFDEHNYHQSISTALEVKFGYPRPRMSPERGDATSPGLMDALDNARLGSTEAMPFPRVHLRISVPGQLVTVGNPEVFMPPFKGQINVDIRESNIASLTPVIFLSALRYVP